MVGITYVVSTLPPNAHAPSALPRPPCRADGAPCDPERTVCAAILSDRSAQYTRGRALGLSTKLQSQTMSVYSYRPPLRLSKFGPAGRRNLRKICLAETRFA
jgi:hypothetical protein